MRGDFHSQTHSSHRNRVSIRQLQPEAQRERLWIVGGGRALGVIVSLVRFCASRTLLYILHANRFTYLAHRSYKNVEAKQGHKEY